MILVDTSVWIEFFKANPEYFTKMDTMLKNRQVITAEPVFAELIYGSKNNKERNTILSYWKILPKTKFSEGSFIESADFANRNNFQNQGIGLVDSVLIKAVKENNLRIWTLDKKILNTLEREFLFI